MRRFGEFEISSFVWGSFALDGGSMFGSVPKNLWSKSIPADEENKIPLVARSLLIKREKQIFLIDVGMGEKWNDKARQIYSIRNNPPESLGVDLAGVTDVILTHLHFDHAGGVSHYQDGKLVLNFPMANHHLQRENWELAKAPSLRERASYLTENVNILNNPQLKLAHGEKEIAPGILVHTVHGHTKGLQWVEIQTGDETIAFPSDLIPTSHHLPVPYIMGYDMCAETSLREKEHFLARAEKGKWILVFEHDSKIAAGRVGRNEKGHFGLIEQIEI